MANTLANHTDFKTYKEIFQPLQETHSKEIELVQELLVKYLYHNQSEINTYKNGGFWTVLETVKNRLRMSKAVFPELKEKVLEHWIDYNHGRDDPWLDEDGEEGRRYLCKDCGCDFTHAEWFDGDYCGDDESDFEGYECYDCYEKKN